MADFSGNSGTNPSSPSSQSSYTTKVTMGLDGIYRWKSPVRLESDREGYRMGIVVCAIVTVLSIGICAVISMDFMISVLPVILGSVAALILLIALCVKLNSSIVQKYDMSDQYVKLGNKEPIYYQQISGIVVHPLYVELQAGARTTRIYCAKEDLFFVKDYIVNHSTNAAVTYDRYGTTEPPS